MNAKAIMSLFLFAGLSVSASVENLDFTGQQSVLSARYQEVTRVVVNVQAWHDSGEVGLLANRGVDVTGRSPREIRDATESLMTQLGEGCLPHYSPGNRYMVGYSCNNADGYRVFAEAHDFVFEGVVPTERFRLNPVLPRGHFHAPGIERASIIVGEGDLAFPFVDTDFGSESLTLDTENGIVQFNDVIIPTVREYIEDGHFTAAHIRFDFADGSVKLYSLDGRLLNGQEEEPSAPSLRIDFSPEARTITITGAPNTSYIVEETPDLGTWQRWKEVTTDAEGFAQATDNRDDIATCFFRIK